MYMVREGFRQSPQFITQNNELDSVIRPYKSHDVHHESRHDLLIYWLLFLNSTTVISYDYWTPVAYWLTIIDMKKTSSVPYGLLIWHFNLKIITQYYNRVIIIQFAYYIIWLF